MLCKLEASINIWKYSKACPIFDISSIWNVPSFNMVLKSYFSICVTLYGCVQCEHSYIDIGWWALPCENTVEMNAA